MHDLFIVSYFLFETLVWFGQLDKIFLQWEEVLCDGFNLAVLNINDKKGHGMHVSLLLRITIWGLFLHS